MPSDEDYKTMSVTRTHIYVSALQSYEFFPSHQNPPAAWLSINCGESGQSIGKLLNKNMRKIAKLADIGKFSDRPVL